MRLFFLLFLIFVFGCSSHKAPYQELTNKYDLPPEMQGCKIYVLGGQYSSTNPLWVVVSPDGKILTTQ